MFYLKRQGDVDESTPQSDTYMADGNGQYDLRDVRWLCRHFAAGASGEAASARIADHINYGIGHFAVVLDLSAEPFVGRSF
jgi:hypothetical protein